jgi:hypothetical protein
MAAIKCVPPDRLEVENAALPPLSVPVPSATKLALHGVGEQVSSENVTVPVAVGGETVAAKVTVCPNIDGFGLDVTVTVVKRVFTNCVSAPDEPG